MRNRVPVVDRYLIRYVLAHVGLVWLGLVWFYMALGMVGELTALQGDYTLADALLYSLLKAPGNAYRVFPFAALIGTLLGLGALAASRQLTVLRAAGCSKIRLMRPALLAVSAALVPAMGVGEWSGSWLEAQARSFRISEITGNIALAGLSGLWLRDGSSMIQIRQPWTPSRQRLHFDDVRLFDVRDGRLCRWAVAAGAQHRTPRSPVTGRSRMDESSAPGGVGRGARRHEQVERRQISPQAKEGGQSGKAWRLNEVIDLRLCDGSETQIHRVDKVFWPTSLSRELLINTPLRPSVLGVRELRAYIDYLSGNQLDAYHYRMALSQRFFYPLTVLSLVMLPLPLMLGPPRLLSRTVRLVIGIGLGVALYVVQELTEAVGSIYRFDATVVGLTPFLLTLAGAVLVYRKAP